MRLIPRELDKLVLHNAGFLAQKRLARYVNRQAMLISQECEKAVLEIRCCAEVLRHEFDM
jgi:urease gamma subunit